MTEKNEYFEKEELSEERNKIILKNILDKLEKICDNQINLKEKLDTIVNQNKKIIDLEDSQNNLKLSRLSLDSIDEDEIKNYKLNQSDDYSLLP